MLTQSGDIPVAPPCCSRHLTCHASLWDPRMVGSISPLPPPENHERDQLSPACTKNSVTNGKGFLCCSLVACWDTRKAAASPVSESDT